MSSPVRYLGFDFFTSAFPGPFLGAFLGAFLDTVLGSFLGIVLVVGGIVLVLPRTLTLGSFNFLAFAFLVYLRSMILLF